MSCFLQFAFCVLLVAGKTIPALKMASPNQNPYLKSSPQVRNNMELKDPQGKDTLSNITTIYTASPLDITLSMTLAPFQEMHFNASQVVFTASLQFPGMVSLRLDLIYEKRMRLKVRSILQRETQQQIKESQHQVGTLKWNQVLFNIVYQDVVVQPGEVRTLVTFTEKDLIFKGVISGLMIKINSNTSSTTVLSSSAKWVSNMNLVSHPISLKGLVLPQNILSTKPPHKIRLLGNEKKLLICHDMANGYKQDINQRSNNDLKHAYRFNHWGISDVFVYFSHQNIAIPPKHYLDICKREQVVCLATFIVQINIDWMRIPIADYLIFLAREYGFDGYLINIEYPVSNATKFKEWLAYLTTNIHSQLPGSLVVLYDAIVNDGSLRHQSGLTELNIDYMDKSDYLFSDYHWNLNSLQMTAAMASSIDRGPDVFMGNDVFGRGSWGGGMFNTYKAVNKINQYNLSTAIFAPGFAYQNEEGRQNYSRFQANDDNLWFGKETSKKHIKFQEWLFLTPGWKQEGDDSLTSSTQYLREFKYNVKDRVFDSVLLRLKVRVTFPKLEYTYKVTLQLLDSGNKIIKIVSETNSIGVVFQGYKEISLILFTPRDSGDKCNYIRVIQSGTGSQSQARNNGVRFAFQVLHLSSTRPEPSVSSNFVERPSNLPYHSFYNVAVSPNYFWHGHKTVDSTGYNFLGDYDLPYQNKMFFKGDRFNEEYNSFAVDVEYCQATGWVGAGSLQLQSEGNFALRLLKLEETIQKVTVRIMVQTKQLPMIGLKFKAGQVVINKVELVQKGDWSQIEAHFDFLQTQSLVGVYLVSPSKAGTRGPIYIGQISVFTSPLALRAIKEKPQVSTIKCDGSPNCKDVYIDLKQFPQQYSVVFIQINSKVVGSLHQSQGYFQNLVGDADKVSIRLIAVLHDGTTGQIYQRDIVNG